MLSVDASKCKFLDVMFQIQTKNMDVKKSVESNSNNVTESSLKSDTIFMASNSEFDIVTEKCENKFMTTTSSKSIENNLQSKIQNSKEDHSETNYWFEKPNQNELKIFFYHIQYNQSLTTFTVRNYINDKKVF